MCVVGPQGGCRCTSRIEVHRVISLIPIGKIGLPPGGQSVPRVPFLAQPLEGFQREICYATIGWKRYTRYTLPRLLTLRKAYPNKEKGSVYL